MKPLLYNFGLKKKTFAAPNHCSTVSDCLCSTFCSFLTWRDLLHLCSAFLCGNSRLSLEMNDYCQVCLVVSLPVWVFGHRGCHLCCQYWTVLKMQLLLDFRCLFGSSKCQQQAVSDSVGLGWCSAAVWGRLTLSAAGILNGHSENVFFAEKLSRTDRDAFYCRRASLYNLVFHSS